MISNVNFNAFYFHLGRLEQFLGTEIFSFAKELEISNEILKSLENKVSDVTHFKKKYWATLFELGLFRVIIFLLIRSKKPSVLIETGVLHGLTSLFILSAIRKNKIGFLHSVDLPSYFESGPSNNDGYYDVLPEGMEPGWIIPDYLLKSWRLHIGRSVDLLPKIIKNYDEIDFFLHDSEHTYENMNNEFEIVWEKLKRGGCLICDNIEANSSFIDFCKKKSQPYILFPEIQLGTGTILDWRFGITIKHHDK